MIKPLDSPASFRPISFTFCVSKLFERIILSRLLFFLESNSILSPHQVGFRPGRSAVDQSQLLVKEMGEQQVGLLFYTKVRWLSGGKCLSRLHEFKYEVKIFLRKKRKQPPIPISQ